MIATKVEGSRIEVVSTPWEVNLLNIPSNGNIKSLVVQ